MEEKEVLIVVDMQRDFIDGALGTAEAQEIVPRVREYIEHFKGRVLYTRDTHREDYLQTREGRKLPVPHCLYGTHGWEITDALQDLRQDAVIDKPTFGSIELAEMLAECALKAKNPCQALLTCREMLEINPLQDEVEEKIEAECAPRAWGLY